MKTKLTPILSAAVGMLMLYGCSKSNQVTPGKHPEATFIDDASSFPVGKMTHDGKHMYSLKPATEAEYSSIPKYSEKDFKAKAGALTLTASAPVVTLSNPAVRDQGQLGSCTSFCESEAYEILWYYKYGAYPPILAPAMLYYEERVKILGEKISARITAPTW